MAATPFRLASRLWPLLAVAALAAVAVLALRGYLSPQLRVAWESVAAFCGF